MTAAAKRIAIVGGGITGLVAAWKLHRAGHQITLLEKSSRLGGCIGTTREEGWISEIGPNSLQQTGDVALLLRELGLGPQQQPANPAARKRYIAREGKLIPVPLSPPGLLTSPLFGIGARLRVFLELLHRPRLRTTDVSLARFVAAHFGQQVVERGLDPFVSGVYAGDSNKLSARFAFPNLWQLERRYGSLLRGLRAQAAEKRTRGDSTGVAPIISFAGGLQTLVETLASQLPPDAIRLGAEVKNVIPGRPGKLIWNHGGNVETGEFDSLVLALPADGLAQLVFGTLGERPLASLEHIPHPPVSCLYLGFRREQIAHALDGFGVLVPASEQRQVLGVIFSSTLFPQRAPDGHVALTVFVGGMRQPEIARLEPAALTQRVLPDLRALLGVTGEPVLLRHTFWPRAIPQYNLGHERFLEPLTRCEEQNRNLFIGTNCRDGISLPDCIKSGLRLAEKASA